MRAIGIDSHKATLACCLVDELGNPLEERTFANDPAGHRALVEWSRSLAAGVRIGIEGSGSFGGAASRLLLAAGGPTCPRSA
jgi:transposase